MLAIVLFCLWAAVILTACQPASAPAARDGESSSVSLGQPETAGGQGVLASLKQREETPIPRVVSDGHPFEEELLGLINREREKAGVEPLVLSRTLASLARKHCQDMGEHRFFGHNGSDGLTFQDRLKQAGYTYSAAAENIFAGNGPYNTPEAAFKAWMNSAAHRANLLNAAYTEVGIGYRYFPSSPYGGYFTADFGKP